MRGGRDWEDDETEDDEAEDHGESGEIESGENEGQFLIFSCRVVPRELQQGAPPGTNFNVKLVDNRAQDYTEPAKPKIQAFSGSGQALGRYLLPILFPPLFSLLPPSSPVTSVFRWSLYFVSPL